MSGRNKNDLVQGWLKKAKKDMHLSYYALDIGADYTDMACYHAQQAAEKALKAYLVWLEVQFPYTHVLEDLLDLVAERDLSLETHRRNLEFLTPLAVESRYPGSAVISLEDSGRLVDAANKLLASIIDLLPGESVH